MKPPLLLTFALALALLGCSGGDDALQAELDAANERLAEMEDEPAAPSSTSTSTTTATTSQSEPAGAAGNPYASGEIVELSGAGVTLTVEILDVVDLTADVDRRNRDAGGLLAPGGQAAVGLLVRLVVVEGSIRPGQANGQLLVASQGVIIGEGCGLQRYGVGEGLDGSNNPDEVLAGGQVEGWVCYQGVDAGATGLLYTPISGEDFWMEVPS